MSFEQQNGKGIIFDNKSKKKNQFQPDWTGSIKSNHVDYKIAAWEIDLLLDEQENDIQNRNYFSIKLTPSVEDAFANDEGDDFAENDNVNNFGFKMLRNTGVLFFNPAINNENSPHIIGEINFSGNIEKIYGYEKISKSNNTFFSLTIPNQWYKEQQLDKHRLAEQEYVKQQIVNLQKRYNQDKNNYLENMKSNKSLNNDLDIDEINSLFGDSNEYLEQNNNLEFNTNNTENNIFGNNLLEQKEVVNTSSVLLSLQKEHQEQSNTPNQENLLDLTDLVQDLENQSIQINNSVQNDFKIENVFNDIIEQNQESIESEGQENDNLIVEQNEIHKIRMEFNIDNLGNSLEELNNLIQNLSQKN